MQVIIILAVSAIVIWLLSFFGSGLSDAVRDIMEFLGNVSPWQSLEPWTAFLIAFCALRLFLLPFQLNNARRNKNTKKLESIMDIDAKEPDRYTWILLAVSVADALFICIIARALSGVRMPWLESHVYSWFGSVVVLFFILILDVVVSAFLIHVINLLVDKPVSMLFHWQIIGTRFIVRRTVTNLANYPFVTDVMVYAPVFLLITIIYRDWPYLVPMLAMCILAKALFTGLANFVSRSIDWYHDSRSGDVAD